MALSDAVVSQAKAKAYVAVGTDVNKIDAVTVFSVFAVISSARDSTFGELVALCSACSGRGHASENGYSERNNATAVEQRDVVPVCFDGTPRHAVRA